MDMNQFTIGTPVECWNVAQTRILKYTVEISHAGLKTHKLISAPQLDVLENKMELQVEKWDAKWDDVQKRMKLDSQKKSAIEKAELETKKAREALENIDDILTHTLSINDAVDWNVLKRHRKYPESQPKEPSYKAMMAHPPRPDESAEAFQPSFSLIERIIPSMRAKRIDLSRRRYSEAVAVWENKCQQIDYDNGTIATLNEKQKEEWLHEIAKWKERKLAFEQEQNRYNNKIDDLERSYQSREPDAIVEYCEIVLNNSEYPDNFPQNFLLEYAAESRILIVEYQLHSMDEVPRIKEMKYVATKGEFKESHITESKRRSIFDDSIYKTVLRTIHELFEADVVGAIEAVSFNGWVKSVNLATGKEENNCIVSIQAKKDEFLEIDLSRVDPKACFKSLKGIASSKLSSLTPVQPILQLTRTDKRFVDGYNVSDKIDNSTNLAAMDWEDFEHLIRELFEKEFRTSGGEVKVTQASRDGGVDAVAFDPDPIRGGKIVIQAKRYTNTVGVAAVRDLYGTVVNEGATKGILVTTADFGPDAYQFAKDKPLTLLSGSNLLHLLERHGHHAKIDLREAKEILSAQEKNR